MISKLSEEEGNYLIYLYSTLLSLFSYILIRITSSIDIGISIGVSLFVIFFIGVDYYTRRKN